VDEEPHRNAKCAYLCATCSLMPLTNIADIRFRLGIMAPMRKELVQRIVAHINRKHWWHCPPLDPKSYKKRGKFFASSFGEAELYGRPLDEPQRVKVCNPLAGSEDCVLDVLGIPKQYPEPEDPRFYQKRAALDAKMRVAALAKGYDSIAIIHPTAFVVFKKTGKIPRSIELNVFNP